MEKFDVLIVSHKKDFYKLPFLIGSIKKNVIGYDKIHIIVNDTLVINDEEVVVHYEQDILKVEIPKLGYHDCWIYQQLLKLLQIVTKEWYLVIDSDVYINNKINPFLNDKPNFFIGNNQYNAPYFHFMKEKLNIDKKFNHSFISELMLFNRKYINEIFNKVNIFTTKKIIELCYNSTVNSHISEYELYGNFIETYYPDLYNKINITSKEYRYNGENWDTEFIENQINSNLHTNYDVIVHHQ